MTGVMAEYTGLAILAVIFVAGFDLALAAIIRAATASTGDGGGDRD